MTRYLVRLCVFGLLLSGSIFVLSCGNDNDNDGVAQKNNNASSSAVQPPKYEGALDGVYCGGINGWVWNRNNPDEEIKVDIYADNKLISTVAAKTLRPDLNGIGSKNYGFSIPIPPDLKDGKPHSVSAKVAGSNYEIKPWEKVSPILTCKPGS